MRHPIALLFLLGSMLLTACAPTVYSDADPTVDLASLRTFTWANSPPLIKSGDHPISALTEANMTRAIQATLEAKGYRFVNSPDADFAVSYSMGARDEIELRSYPVTYAATYSRWTWGRPYYGRGYRPPPPRTVFESREVEVTKGTLSVDIFSVEERRPIWHAQASKNLTAAELAGSSFENLFESAQAILGDFPARTP